MPELSDVIKTGEKTKNASVVDATVINNEPDKDIKPAAKPAAKKAKAKPAVKKPAIKKSETTKTKKPAIKTEPETKKTKPEPKKVKPEPKKVKPETVVKKEVNGDDVKTEPKLQRPPLEMLTQDIQKYILEQNICGKKIEKLEYKCGKIIFGIKNNEGKDFRTIAFKARKKSKSVAGKSRCIYYFGMTKDLKVITKNHKGTSTTEFGKCSVQVKKPIQLILDKTTFDENFDQNAKVVIETLKKLVDLCILHKEDQWNEMQEKKQAKINETKEKAAAKKLATERKNKAIQNAKTKKINNKKLKDVTETKVIS